MRITIVAIAALAVAVSGPALAQGMPDPYGDATVTRAEVEAQAAQRFAALDTDKNGSLSPEERRAGRGPGGPGGAGGPGGPGGPGGRGPGGGTGPQDQAAYVTAQVTRFEQQDADKDGKLTKAERDAFRAEMRQRMQAGGQ